jgi:hypothetical protein
MRGNSPNVNIFLFDPKDMHGLIMLEALQL